MSEQEQKKEKESQDSKKAVIEALFPNQEGRTPAPAWNFSNKKGHMTLLVDKLRQELKELRKELEARDVALAKKDEDYARLKALFEKSLRDGAGTLYIKQREYIDLGNKCREALEKQLEELQGKYDALEKDLEACKKADSKSEIEGEKEPETVARLRERVAHLENQLDESAKSFVEQEEEAGEQDDRIRDLEAQLKEAATASENATDAAVYDRRRAEEDQNLRVAAEQDLKESKEEVERLLAERVSFKERIVGLTSDIWKQKEERGRLESLLEGQSDKIESLDKLLGECADGSASQVAELQKTVVDQSAKLQSLENELATTRDKITTSTSARTKSERTIKEQSTKIRSLEKQLATRTEMDSSDQDHLRTIASLKTQLETAEQNYEHLEAQLVEEKSAHEKTESKLKAETETRISKSNDFNELLADFNTAREIIQAAEDDADARDEKEADMREYNAIANIRIEELETRLEEKDQKLKDATSDNVGISTQLKDSQTKNEKLVLELAIAQSRAEDFDRVSKTLEETQDELVTAREQLDLIKDNPVSSVTVDPTAFSPIDAVHHVQTKQKKRVASKSFADELATLSNGDITHEEGVFGGAGDSDDSSSDSSDESNEGIGKSAPPPEYSSRGDYINIGTQSDAPSQNSPTLTSVETVGEVLPITLGIETISAPSSTWKRTLFNILLFAGLSFLIFLISLMVMDRALWLEANEHTRFLISNLISYRQQARSPSHSVLRAMLPEYLARNVQLVMVGMVEAFNYRQKPYRLPG